MSDEHNSRRLSVIIIGGGASGVVLAAHLLRQPNADLRVTLIEKRPTFGQGVAYSTPFSDHVLNVTTLGMSAFADDPEHFWRWLLKRGLAQPDKPQTYMPRHVYGDYLADILDDLHGSHATTGRLHLVREFCTAIVPTPSGVEVQLSNGSSFIGHVAVLAVGHEEEPTRGNSVKPGSAADTPLDPDDHVLVLGTGLSMVDTWLLLERRGHRGRITALSRRGLLPLAHHNSKPIRLDSADIPLGTELSYFVRWFRDLVRDTERAGGDWREVVDGLRPFNRQIWQSWPASAKRRFIEHTRAWWDIHRHRMPPEIHARISQAVVSGRLEPKAGKLLGTQPAGDRVLATIRPRHQMSTETIEVARIYDCTGISADRSNSSNPLVRSLVNRGIAKPDPLRIGLDVTSDCAVIDNSGIASGRLFAVGPLTRGTFFEIEAIPDIRIQCATLAELLTHRELSMRRSL